MKVKIKGMTIAFGFVTCFSIKAHAQLAPQLRPDNSKLLKLYNINKQKPPDALSTQLFPQTILPAAPDDFNRLGEIYFLHSGGMLVLKPFKDNPAMPNTLNELNDYIIVENRPIPNPFGFQNKQLELLLHRRKSEVD